MPSPDEAMIDLQFNETFLRSSSATLEFGRALSPKLATLCALCKGPATQQPAPPASAPHFALAPSGLPSAQPWISINRDAAPWRHILNYLHD